MITDGRGLIFLTRVAVYFSLFRSGSARMDWLDRWNRTALHWAIFHGRVDVCQALLDAGAKTTGTLGEQGGRIRMADVPCGNLPNRVLEPQFVL